MVTKVGAPPKTDTEVADQIMEAVKDMMKDGWCTGDLFQPGGKACAIGNLLKTVGVTKETGFAIDTITGDYVDRTDQTYKHPGIQDAMRELATDIMLNQEFVDYYMGYFLGAVPKWDPVEVVWKFNDGVAKTEMRAATQFLITAERLYRRGRRRSGIR